VEEKVDIEPCEGEIEVVKLKNGLQQLEVYFNVHIIGKEKNISFS
jgi:hypothetical protein